LRADHPDRDAVQARGTRPERAPKGRVPDRGALRRTALRRAALMDALLQATAVRKEFGGLVAVDDVDFVVPRGSIVSLIGPNGAGKTTFFNVLTGVYKPTSGRIELDGENVTGKPPHAITKRGMGRTFQNIRLFPLMTALENVLVGMHSRLHGGILRSILRTPGIKREEREARERGRELLELCGLRGRG